MANTLGETRHYFLGLGPEGFHRIAYRQWDGGGERTIFCAHGLTRNSADFAFLGRALAERARARVVAIDMVGRGASDWLSDGKNYTYLQYMADAASLIARLDCTRIDWIGTSMGGLLGMMLAAQSKTPLRSLFINDIGPFIPQQALARLAGYVGVSMQFGDRAEALAHLKRIHAPYGPLTAAQWEHMAESCLAPDPWRLTYDPKIADNLRVASEAGSVDLWPVWEKIAIPILTYWGEESDILQADTVARMRQKSAVKAWSGIGHAPALYSEEQIAPIVAWITAQAADPS
ncbi:MAG TPA: alpha/beta hydrolase [Dongiaceae bacterium]|jgi:pimeloyl-ACP methyl ester carboxylesterase|nr:alpha/beta hydrolase [Dongiaceae bacterium]